MSWDCGIDENNMGWVQDDISMGQAVSRSKEYRQV